MPDLLIRLIKLYFLLEDVAYWPWYKFTFLVKREGKRMADKNEWIGRF